LRPLLDERVELIRGAHSRRYRDHAAAALGQLLAQDWPAIIRSGGRPAVYDVLLQAADYGRRRVLPLVSRPPQ